MSKFKKFAAATLAAVICATSFAAPAPATADAADYCCHTIYYGGREVVGHYTLETHVYNKPFPAPQFSGNPNYIPALCDVVMYIAQDVYRCYKCDYHYYRETYYSPVTHTSCGK